MIKGKKELISYKIRLLEKDGDKKNSDKTEKFCEKDSKKGSLGMMYGKGFMVKTGLNR